MRKSSMIEEVESLTIHGLPRISSSKSKFFKAMWLALCLTAAGFLINFTAQSILKHLRHEVTVKAERKQFSVLSLPAITFCNTNFYTYSTYQGTAAPVKQELPKNCSMDDMKFFKNKINQEYFKIGCKIFFGSKAVVTSLKDADISSILKFPDRFSLLPHSYPCFTLNMDSELLQFVRGAAAGFHLLLDYDEHERKTSLNEKENSKNPFEEKRNGLYVAIHSPNDFHGFEGIPLSPGFETRISFTKTIIKRKKSPFPSKCVDDDEQEFTNIFPGRPNLDSCFSSCFYVNLYRSCSYVPPFMKPFMPKSRFPKQDHNITCPQELLHGGGLLYDCKCKTPCYEERYETNVQQRVWPQEWQVGLFEELLNESIAINENKTLTIHDVRKRLIKVSLFFDELAEYIYEERELYEFISVLSDIGGQMGLFIGASLISLIEVVWLLLMFVKGILKPKEKVDDSMA